MLIGHLYYAYDIACLVVGLLLLAFLPALVFFSAFETNWYMFNQSLSQIILLAVVGLLIVTILGACAVKVSMA